MCTNAKGWGFEIEEVFFRQTSHEFCAEAVSGAALVQNNESVGAGEGGFDRVKAQGRQRAEIEDIEFHLIFIGEVVGDIGGQSDHFTIGHHGGKIAGRNVAWLPDGSIVRIELHGCFGAAIQPLVFKQ